MQMSTNTSHLLGNDELLEMLTNEARSGMLCHAYIVEGPPKSGKKLLALTLADVLASTPEVHEKIFDGICPDIKITAPADGKKTIGIDDVRAIRRAAYVKPNDLDFKMFVIDGCDKMTVQAQNALLKLLEEPPAATYFFLLCESAAALLPTVRSRAPLIRMHIFSNDELKDLLTSRASPSPRELDLIISGAQGSLGRALEALAAIDKKGSAPVEQRQNVLSVLERILKKSPAEIYTAVNLMPRARDELSGFVEELRVAIRDMFVIRTASSDKLLFGMPEELRKSAGKLSPARILELDRLFESFGEGVAQNINIQSAKLALAADLVLTVGS